jgi:N-acetylglucosaminyl-diphospho-decaprenol L-rhamnosyltransferase
VSVPDLSICIANWNCREHLRRCLESIRIASLGIPCETIVVDNASADGSADMVESDFPEVILIRNGSNRGFAAANNQAAQRSRATYLLFLNNDTIVGPESLVKIVTFMRDHPGAGIVGPRLIGKDGKPQRSTRPKPTLAACLHRLVILRWTMLFDRAYKRYRRDRFDANRPGPVETLLGAAACLPHAVFEHHRGWDEGFVFGLEDLDLSVRVAKTHDVLFMADADIVHLGKSSSRGNSGFFYTGLECGYARYLRKHAAGRIGALAYKVLFFLNLPFALLSEAFRQVWRGLTHGKPKPGKKHSQLRPLGYFLIRGLRKFLSA